MTKKEYKKISEEYNSNIADYSMKLEKELQSFFCSKYKISAATFKKIYPIWKDEMMQLFPLAQKKAKERINLLNLTIKKSSQIKKNKFLKK